MGDQLQFVDDGGQVRLAGELVDEGATVGDVLTVQADGSISAAAGGGSSSLLTASLTLNDDQIKALPSATDNVIVAAPGAGKIIVPLFSAWIADTSGGAYTNFNAFSSSAPFASSIYLAWDAPNNFNDASGPIRADSSLGGTEIRFTNAGPISGNLLTITGPSISTAVNLGIAGSTAAVNLGYEDAALYVVGQNNNLGDFTGGDPANKLSVTVAYFVADLPT